MIDFRYHLVSLVAVFLALAIGIVMGAGPLRENLGEQLTVQVEQLRADRDAMRGENEKVTTENRELADYIDETGPELVADTLPNKSVVIIVDHESMEDKASKVQRLVRAAGGNPTVIITLSPALWDPDKGAERAEAVERLASTWPAIVPDSGSNSARLAKVITRITSQGFELSDAERSQIAEYLRGSGFISTSRSDIRAADGLAYVGATQDTFAVQGDSAAQATERISQLDEVSTALIQESSDRMDATAVATATSVPASSEGIVRAIRGSAQAPRVSTVDGLNRASGATVLTLALAASYTGEPGAFGVASDAQDIAPNSVAIRQLAEATGSDGESQDGQDVPASDGGGQ